MVRAHLLLSGARTVRAHLMNLAKLDAAGWNQPINSLACHKLPQKFQCLKHRGSRQVSFGKPAAFLLELARAPKATAAAL